MLTTAERVNLLRSVTIFSQISDDILAKVATLLGDAHFESGETIFEKGGVDQCMFIIAKGRVHIHDGELTVTHLGRRDVLGELALLDAKPHTASATAVEDTRLLCLGQELLYELMASHMEVTHGIIRVLTHYVRVRAQAQAEDFKYIQQVHRIASAAADVEGGVYELDSLDEVAQRPDELGLLAQCFQRMAREVQAREERLRQQVRELRIEIDHTKKAHQVAEITETDYFQQLKEKARHLRRRQGTREQ